MSSITFSKKDLVSLVDHHIALLERFGITDEAPFSIIYFSLEHKKEEESIVMFEKILRQTDALFQIKNNFIVMLPGTDWNGATELLSGIQDFLDQSAEDNIVTFPEDGKNAKVLLRKLQELVKNNCEDIIKIV
ncbi:hypothetical protein [Sulfurospirillum arcachonense]|uniref:hypothetical protein n=1 Tax=Sulfurospirillum arcachonense TaxID=57666 RepID=UPI00046A1F85|nr:hypothetical protein [Sulfurospirillum arcachonense]